MHTLVWVPIVPSAILFSFVFTAFNVFVSSNFRFPPKTITSIFALIKLIRSFYGHQLLIFFSSYRSSVTGPSLFLFSTNGHQSIYTAGCSQTVPLLTFLTFKQCVILLTIDFLILQND